MAASIWMRSSRSLDPDPTKLTSGFPTIWRPGTSNVWEIYGNLWIWGFHGLTPGYIDIDMEQKTVGNIWNLSMMCISKIDLMKTISEKPMFTISILVIFWNSGFSTCFFLVYPLVSVESHGQQLKPHFWQIPMLVVASLSLSGILEVMSFALYFIFVG